MDEKLKTVEVEFQNMLNIINSHFNVKYTMDTLGIFFCKGDARSPAGTYVYWDKEGYHIEGVGDRGGVVSRETYKNVTDVCFALCEYAATTAAIEYEVHNREENRDSRRIIFAKQLEVLHEIDFNFYLKGKSRIEEILSKNPYNDAIDGRLM